MTTKESLIDVARRLFAENGVERTTMHQIAERAKRSRRTIYTYFKDKGEIFRAVVDSELTPVREELKAICRETLKPEKKLVKFLYAHLRLVREVVARNGSLQANFFRNIFLVEQVRRPFDVEEVRMIRGILTEGVNALKFDIPNVDMTARLLHGCFKGIEVPFISGQFGGNSPESLKEVSLMVRNFMFNGIKRHS